MTIRGRVVKMFAGMGTLMLVQVALVLYLQRESASLREEADPYHITLERPDDPLSAGARAQHARHHVALESQMRRATMLMVGIPIVCAFALVYLSVDATVHTLRPMAALGRAAQHLARGEFVVPPPAGFGGEIAVVRDAFEQMATAIQRREEALNVALARERDHTSELKRLQTALERQRTDLLAIIETIPTSIVIYDRVGRVVLSNKAVASIQAGLETTGPVPQTLGEAQRQFELTHKDGSPLSRDEWPATRALHGETILGLELGIHGPQGHILSMLCSAAPLQAERGVITGAVVAFQDITRLLEVDRMKSDFVSIVSHELRTPLTSIRGGLQLALADTEAVRDPAVHQLLTVALNNSERLIRIVNDILDIAKIESGGMPLDPRPCRVDELLRVAEQSVGRLALAEDVQLTRRLPADLPPVLADFDRVVQALVNLLSNAIKFAPPDSEVVIEGTARGNMVALAIRDQGPGISADNLARLFQKFQQVDSSTSRSVGGTGLGLVITKALIEQHGGHIEVESLVGRGSTFTIVLPAAQSGSAPARQVARAPAIGEDADAPLGPSADGSAPRVLVAEDDEDLLMVLTTAMERGGFEVETARNGRDAWRMATDRAFDLLLLDLAMPEMDGFEVIRRVRGAAASHDMPIVAISGSDRLGPSEQRARDLGANLFLAKPLDANVLVREVRQLLASWRTPSPSA